MKFIIALILINICFQSTKAQDTLFKNNPDIKSLKVGENVPDLLISKILNDSLQSRKMSDFKDQLLILDFMETSCSSCILALPKMDTLQKKYGDKLKIMVVTPEKETYIKNYLNNPSTYIAKRKVNLPWIVEDKLLSSYFKHWYISHIVWIYNGKVKAITHSEYVNNENVKGILEGRSVDLPVKNDEVGFDYEKQSLFKITANVSETGKDLKQRFYTAITGNQNGLDGRRFGSVVDTINHNTRTYLVNKSILTAYTIAWNQVNSAVPVRTSARTILEVKDSSKYIYSTKSGLMPDWEINNTYCYESVLPQSTSIIERYQKMINDLNTYLRINGRWENRLVKCLVITRVKDHNQNFSSAKGAIRIKDLIKRIDLNALLYEKRWPLIVVDESSFPGKLILDDWNDPVTLKKSLQKLGFDLNEEKRILNMFVVTETSN